MTDPTAIPSFNPDPNGTVAPPESHELRDKILGIFNDDNIDASVDPDGDISFKIDDQQLFVRVIEGEPGLMRVFGQWHVSEDDHITLEKQLLAANDVTLSLNIIKTGIANGTLVVTGEHLVTEHSDVRMLLQTTTNMILQAVQLWHQAATGDAPHAANTDPQEMAAMLQQQEQQLADNAAATTAQDGADGPSA